MYTFGIYSISLLLNDIFFWNRGGSFVTSWYSTSKSGSLIAQWCWLRLVQGCGCFTDFLHHDWDLSENINLVQVHLQWIGGSQMKVKLRCVFGGSIFLEVTKAPWKISFFASQGKDRPPSTTFEGRTICFREGLFPIGGPKSFWAISTCFWMFLFFRAGCT